MKIESLKLHPEFIPALAAWHHAEWAYLHDDDSVERRIAEFQAEFETDGIPKTFVAVSKTTLLGSASLLPHDMDTRMDLSPWLASVFVAPEHRNRGIGSALIKHVMLEAARLGYRTIYLFTPDRAPLYARLGWSHHETLKYHGHQVEIMTIDLT
ncbi:MAG: GNAT family N-acetyltransferase [Candidatus Abyssubacteria bacterium]